MRIFVRWWEVSREGSVRYSSSRTISGTNTAPTVICAAITSKMNKAKLPTHIEINASAYDIVRIPSFFSNSCAPLIKKG